MKPEDRRRVEAIFPNDPEAVAAVERGVDALETMPTVIEALGKAWQEAVGSDWPAKMAGEFSAAAFYLERVEHRFLEARRVLAAWERARQLAEWKTEDEEGSAAEPEHEMISATPVPAPAPTDQRAAMKRLGDLFEKG